MSIPLLAWAAASLYPLVVRHRYRLAGVARARRIAPPIRTTSTRVGSSARAVVRLPIDISDVTSPVDAAALRDALLQFNCQVTGHRHGRSLASFLRNDGDTLIAGIDGYTWGGYARIDYLWVSERYRGSGLGSRLLAAAEDEARARGCTSVVLDTYSFQAPEFYRQRHYVEVGVTKDTPEGHTQMLFQKEL